MSGGKNDWVTTATKLEQALAKVREAEAAGLPRDELEIYYLRVEKLASDPAPIVRNIQTFKSARGEPIPRHIRIEDIGRRAEELMTEIDIQISTKRYLAVLDAARLARIALHAPAVVRVEPLAAAAGGAEQPPEYGS